MQSNMKRDVVDSYNELIKGCKLNIKKEIHVEENEQMIAEYVKILNEVNKKSQEEYDELTEKINEIYRYSLFVHEILLKVRPYMNDSVDKPKPQKVKV